MGQLLGFENLRRWNCSWRLPHFFTTLFLYSFLKSWLDNLVPGACSSQTWERLEIIRLPVPKASDCISIALPALLTWSPPGHWSLSCPVLPCPGVPSLWLRLTHCCGGTEAQAPTSGPLKHSLSSLFHLWHIPFQYILTAEILIAENYWCSRS